MSTSTIAMTFSRLRTKCHSVLHSCRIKSVYSKIYERKMTSHSDSDHLSRTATNTRHEVVTTAEVKEIEDISKTVKMLKDHTQDKQFGFKAGQWVDMFIPGLETVGGFSMCSPPHLLTETGILHLAIKFAKHPPAYWVHTKCKVGDHIELRAGGDFFYDPSPDTEHSDLLLLAGGVGINPLYSMLQHFVYLHPSKSRPSGEFSHLQFKSVSMLYSARNMEELIFKDNLIDITSRYDNVTLKLFSTRQSVSGSQFITNGRIQIKDIEAAVSKLDRSNTEVFVCGPLPFIETMKSYCVESGIKENKVYFEKWW